jgi:putative endonuclease
MGTGNVRGARGESLAAAWLELAGLQVIGRNVRLGGVEVDLVAREGDTHVVVEVKLRGRADYGGAALAVDRVKRVRLVRAARALEQSGAPGVRIDVIAIETAADGLTLRHYRNAVTD